MRRLSGLDDVVWKVYIDNDYDNNAFVGGIVHIPLKHLETGAIGLLYVGIICMTHSIMVNAKWLTLPTYP